MVGDGESGVRWGSGLSSGPTRLGLRASEDLEGAMRRVFFWITVFSGVGAAYLMFKRGAPVGEIAQKAVANPVGALVDEVKATF